NLFGLAHPAERMCAQWFQPRSVSDRSCEHVGDKDPAAQGLAQCLDPRNLIDRGADDRKVKAIDSTYIAIEHLAKMECEIDGGNRLAHLCSVSVKPVKAVHCFGSGVERPATGFVACCVDKGKAREHAVAEELQHLSAVWTQRGRQRLEYVVKHFNKNWPRRHIGEWSEAADIGIPQDGLNTFDRSTFNHTGVNTTAGIAAEISGEQASGNRVLGIGHKRKCYRGQHSLDQAEIVLAKALWGIGREMRSRSRCPRMPLSPCQQGSVRRDNQISRHRGSQLHEDWKIALRLASAQPTPQAQRQASLGGDVAQMSIGAVPQVLLIDFAALASYRVDRVTIAPPRVGVTSPLRM